MTNSKVLIFYIYYDNVLDMSSEQFTGRGEITPDQELALVRLTQLAIQMALRDVEADIDISEKPSEEEIEYIQNIEQMASSIVRHSRSFLDKMK